MKTEELKIMAERAKTEWVKCKEQDECLTDLLWALENVEGITLESYLSSIGDELKDDPDAYGYNENVVSDMAIYLEHGI